MAIREDRQMNQEEMAELLAMSQSTYSRLERNETMLPFEDLARVADKLKVPVQELLPEIFTVNNNPTGGSSGIVFGNDFNVTHIVSQVHNHFYSADETAKRLQARIDDLEAELLKITNGNQTT